MYCEKCGRQLRIGTERVGIDERNLPVIHRFGYCDNCRLKWDLDLPVAPPAPPQMRCPRCGGTNIQFNLENVVTNYGSRTEMRKKSPITNMGNSLGRKGMILATGGLWALTPKKSKYNEIQRGSVQTQQVKTAICQHCGWSWRIF